MDEKVFTIFSGAETDFSTSVVSSLRNAMDRSSSEENWA